MSPLSALSARLDQIPRLPLLGAPTPLEYLPRLSRHFDRDIYIKRDDLTPLAFGGNKLRKLEFLLAHALQQGADTLITAGAIQSNHVRQTAAVAAKLGLHCVALLENPIASRNDNYLSNGNRLLLDLFNTQTEMCQALDDPPQQLAELAERVAAQGFRPYVIAPGGSSPTGALGYVACAREIAQQIAQRSIQPSASLSPISQLPGPDNPFAVIIVASGSAGTHAGLLVGAEQWLPDSQIIGVTVSRRAKQQQPIVKGLQQALAQQLAITSQATITLWDNYFAPAYGEPNIAGNAAIKLLAQLEGILLDPVYTGKAMAGLIDHIHQQHLPAGPLLFIHTGGAPALFAYHRHV